ncbi:MAG: DUF485 domain-containing protein [Rhizobacter sp.]
MQPDLTSRIANDPRYRQLKSRRTRFGWWLTLSMMVVYYGFILLVAYNKPFLSTRLGDGVMTIGMPIGLAIIVFTIVITGVYVRRANGEYDALTEQIAKEALK